jgi:hypothetical protein
VAVDGAGREAVTISRDGSARLWHVADGTEKDRWVDGGTGLVGLAVSRPLMPAVCGDERGGVHIIDLGDPHPSRA